MMRGYGGGDPYDPRSRRKMDNGNEYLPTGGPYSVETARLPYPSALAYQQLQQQQQQHVAFASPPRMQYDPGYYQQQQQQQQQQQPAYGRIAPTNTISHNFNNLHDGLVPPNLMSPHPHPHVNVYGGLPTSPTVQQPQSVTSPNNHLASPMMMMAAAEQQQQQQQLRSSPQKVRYDERVVQVPRSPARDTTTRRRRQEDRNPSEDEEKRNVRAGDGDGDQDGERYQEIYHQVFARHSRTPSEARTQTEHTTRYAQTATMSGSTRTSQSSSSSQSSSGSSSFSEDAEDWEENIRSTLNEMAGNLKNLGGIQCNQAGPDSTELQVRLNLPVPMQYMDQLDIAAKQGLNRLDMAKQGLNTAMATLSPKKCDMQYSHIDDQVFDMERRFAGTMNDLQGNVMPVYKSLFQSQSDESSEDDEEDDTEFDDDDEDDEEEESSYEDPRFLPKPSEPLTVPTEKRISSRVLSRENLSSMKDTAPISRVPSHIIITDSPSDFSSADSWRLSSTAAPLAKATSKHGDIAAIAVKEDKNKNSFDVKKSKSPGERHRDNRDSPDWIPATKTKLAVVERESPVDQDKKEPGQIPKQSASHHPEKKKSSPKETKSKPRKATAGPAEIPQAIDLVRPSGMPDEIVETYSEITTDIPDTESKQPPEATGEMPGKESAKVEADNKHSHDGDMKNHAISTENDENKVAEGDELMKSRGPVQKSLDVLSSREHMDGTEAMEPTETIDYRISDGDELMQPRERNPTVLEANSAQNENDRRIPLQKVTAQKVEDVPKPVLNPLYRKAILLRKKAASGGDESREKNQPSTTDKGKPTGVLPQRSINLNSVTDGEPSQVLVPGDPQEPTCEKVNEAELSDETKLDQAVDEVFGASDDAPDDEVGKPVENPFNDFVLPDKNGNSEISEVGNHTDEEEEMPDDERSLESQNDKAAVSDNGIVDPMSQTIETIPSDIPDDERLDLSVKGDLSQLGDNASTKDGQPTLGHHFDSREVAQDASSLDEPFDIPMNSSKSAEGKKDLDDSLVQSDLSFQSAKQESASKAAVESVQHEERAVLSSPGDSGAENLTESSRIRSSLSSKRDRRSTEEPDDCLMSVAEPNARVGDSKKEVFESASNRDKNSILPVLDPLLVEQQHSSTGYRDTSVPDQISNVDVLTEEDPGELPSCGGHGSIDGGRNTIAAKDTLKDVTTEESHKAASEEFVNSSEQDKFADVGKTVAPGDTGAADELADVGKTEAPGDTGAADELADVGKTEVPGVTGAADELADAGKTEAPGVTGATKLFINTDDEPLIPRRVHRNRASLYKVQGFAEYCKKILSPNEKEDSKENDFAVTMVGHDRENAPVGHSSEDTRDGSKSGPKCHQRTLHIDLEDPEASSIDDHKEPEESSIDDHEDPEESSIDDHRTWPKEEKIDAQDDRDGTSSIDRDPDVYEGESEYSTTNTEDQSASISQSEGSTSREMILSDEDSVRASSYSDSSNPESSYMEEQSDIETNGNSSEGSEREDVLPNMKSVNAQSDPDLHMSATRRLRNQIDIEQEQVEIRYLSQHTRTAIQTLSSEASTKTGDTRSKSTLTLDETLRSNLSMPSGRRFGGSTNKEPTSMSKSILAARSMDTHLTSPLTSSFTVDTPLAAASTISTMRTFDHETVSSGQHSALQRHQSYESSTGTSRAATAYSRSHLHGRSEAIPVTAVYDRPSRRELSRVESSFRIVSFACHVVFSILFFFFEWGRFFVGMLRRKRHAKVECAPARLGPRQTDQVLRREEIQERSIDSLIHRTNANPRASAYHQHRQPYLLHHREHDQEHFTATMTPVGFEDDPDEVGTCVGSIVPDTHYPDSGWKVSTPRQQAESCDGSVLGRAYSRLSRRRQNEEEASNWMD